MTHGYGVDFAVDTTGVEPVMVSAIHALAQGGTAALIAVTAKNITISSWNDLCVDDKKVIGVNMGDDIPGVDIPRLIDFYQHGMFPFEKTEKFYKFEDINKLMLIQVAADHQTCLDVDEDYQPEIAVGWCHQL